MRAPRTVVVVLLLLLGSLFTSSVAVADIDDAEATNVKEGDNRQTTNQGGRSGSGDAVGGQVTGVVSGGRTSVDATNASRDSSVQSGDVVGTNRAATFVGQTSDTSTAITAAADITDSAAVNLQEGDNRLTVNQTASYSTGDGVAGQVIGAVTSPGGSASIVAANRSEDVDVTTGDAEGSNDAAAFVGQHESSCFGFAEFATCTASPAITADITDSFAERNLQEGDNRLTLRQAATGSTGDGVAGQVIGAVSAGATSIDATNASTGVSVQTGDVETNNDFAGLSGQNASECALIAVFATCTTGPALTADISRSEAEFNLQEGDNRVTARQSATAASGDGVAGEVIGAVTSAGGSASIVAANTSRDSDVTTGDADANNDGATFAGQNTSVCGVFFAFAAATCTTGPVLTADIDSSVGGGNLQEGDNRSSLGQTANAATGDGVAGQVIGSVSAGATSIDATNASTDVTVDTGDAEAANGAATFVGQNVAVCFAVAVNAATCTVGPVLTADISDSEGGNVQEGDNSGTLNQSANATSGDGVGGEVIGAVTLAGGSTSIVAANTSTNADISTGDATSANDAVAFVGHNISVCNAFTAGSATCTAAGPGRFSTADIDSVTAVNVQEGDNRLRASQSANASTGDGVGGQVLGVVSAGATSVDARNRSEDVVADTGDADATNSLSTFIGLNVDSATAVEVSIGDIDGVSPLEDTLGLNVQEGDNSKTLTQTAEASSGDAVAGQVLAGVTAGVITGAGGSASVVVDNTSTGIDSSTGDAFFDNTDVEFVGLNVTGASLIEF